jgi:hypothetical protein
MDTKIILNPYYITGFADAEGCFNVTISPRVSGNYQVSLRFSIELHQRDLSLLKNIKSIFNDAGTLNLRKDKRFVSPKVTWSVRNFDDIINTIIPHFDKYPLLTQKQADFLLFKEIALLMKNKEHLTPEGLSKIVAIKASMNLGLSNNLLINFLDIKPYIRPEINTIEIPDPHWIAGFIDGDGSFFVNVAKFNSKLGYSVKLMFRLAQHNRDLNLLNLIIKYLDCGTIQRKGNSIKDFSMIDLNVSKFNDIYTKIIPFFNKYRLESIKSKDFEDFCKVADIMFKNEHKTLEGINKIIEIKANMNSNRKL